MSIAADTRTILSESQCWEHLATAGLGRLVTVDDGNPAIYPVNFAVQDRTILIRTAEGTKLVGAAINNNVLFEADHYDSVEGWSVIVAGVTRSLYTNDEIAEAEKAELTPWTGSDKNHYLRIRPRKVTGRHFVFSAGPAQIPVGEDPVLGHRETAPN
ncbi:pyridoxamine 5'-phosphate oxidase [Mycolicibacterium parafortuitum]|uniref:Pyridoxamine 5'-phosphate oxidase n=1 Tax=Mycolicibacterium parafortuitum TaxID=39692 RepID=A0A7I7U8V7_MYCPF|nr:pyridoxamine 5'-phosphate oxidase family protein [Mycolicibacterium parafortuitum]PQE02277.1 pyridoxamine 5'-phosphate oxidase [Mycobacterium sp. EPG1]BBY77401.1 pyridoxamine 5'-phosphate oxidase [Mycolicibacterium parafortuitum]